MPTRVLIVEDEFLIALAIEDAAIEAGFQVIGMAATLAEAQHLAGQADIAVVDVNLQDGVTGPTIGHALALRGVKVVFMTGNPETVASGVPGVVGVMTKPVLDADLTTVLRFLADKHLGQAATPPRSLMLFAAAA